jgi:hypothetical protein
MTLRHIPEELIAVLRHNDGLALTVKATSLKVFHPQSQHSAAADINGDVSDTLEHFVCQAGRE